MIYRKWGHAGGEEQTVGNPYYALQDKATTLLAYFLDEEYSKVLECTWRSAFSPNIRRGIPYKRQL